MESSTIQIPSRPISIVDFAPIPNPTTKWSRQSQYWYKIDLVRSKFDPFELKDRFKDRKVQIKDQNVWLKDQKSQLKDRKSQLKTDLYQKGHPN